MQTTTDSAVAYALLQWRPPYKDILIPFKVDPISLPAAQGEKVSAELHTWLTKTQPEVQQETQHLMIFFQIGWPADRPLPEGAIELLLHHQVNEGILPEPFQLARGDWNR